MVDLASVCSCFHSHQDDSSNYYLTGGDITAAKTIRFRNILTDVKEKFADIVKEDGSSCTHPFPS